MKFAKNLDLVPRVATFFQNCALRHDVTRWTRAALAMGLMLASGSLQAQVIWGTTPPTNFLDDNNNWSGGSVPNSAQIASFSSANFSSNGLSPQSTIVSFAGISLAAGAGALKFTGPGSSNVKTLSIGSAGVANSSSNTLTFDVTSLVNIVLSANATFLANGAIQVLDDSPNGASTGFNIGANSLTLDGTSSSNSSIQKGLTGTGSITKSGTGTWTLSGANSYSGGTTINAGTLAISADNNLGAAAGSLTLSGGTLQTTASLPLSNNRGISLGAGGGTLNTDLGTTLTYGGIIAGANALTKTGGGTLTLSGGNTFSGGLNINAGQISIGSDTSLGTSTGALALNNGVLITTNTMTLGSSRAVSIGTLGSGSGFSPTNNTTLTVGNAITGGGGLTKYNNGTLVLSGANTYAGGTTIVVGTLQIGANGSTGSVTGNIANNGTLTFARSDASNFSGIISGTGLVQQTIGTLTLSGANTYTGGTSFNGGTIAISLDANLGATPGSLTFNGGTLQSTASVTLNSNRGISLGASGGTFSPDTLTTLTHGGIISGSGALIKTGGGLLTLSGSNTFMGGVALNGGQIAVSSDSNLGAPGGALALNGGNLFSTATFTLDPTRSVSLSGAQPGFSPAGGTTLTYGGVLSGTGSLWKYNNGTLLLSGANTYSGGTTLWVGTVEISADNNLGAASGGLTFMGGTLRLNNGLSSARNVLLNSGGGTIDTTKFSATFSGAISGAGSLTKQGTGALTLTGVSTHTGGTIINAGELQLASTGALSTGNDVTINGSGTFHTFANQTIRGLISSSTTSNVIIETGATLTSNLPTIDNLQSGGASGIASFAGNITGAGSFLKNGGSNSTLILTGTSNLSGLTTVSSGTLQIGNGGISGFITGNISTGNTTIGNGTLDFNRSDPVAYPGVLSGNGTVVKDGVSILTVSGSANTFNGSLAINAGTLAFSGSNTGANLTANVASGAVLDLQNDLTLASLSGAGSTQISTSKTLTIGTGAGNFSSIVTGAGGVTFNNPSTILANETYTGTTTIKSGTLSLGNGGTTGSLNGNITISLSAPNTGGVSFNRSDNLIYGGANGVISGNGNFDKSGTGTLTLSGANTYTGATTINSGVLAISQDSNLGAVPGSITPGSLTLNGGTLENTATLPFTLAANRGINLIGSGGTFLTDAGSTLTVGGAISGGTNLTKSGTGTLVLAGASLHGGTIINAGELQLASTGSLSPSGNVTLSGNSIFRTFATNQTIRDLISSSTASVVSIESGATLASNMPSGDVSTFAGVLSGAGSFLKNGGVSTLILTGSSPLTGQTTVSSGTLQLGNGGTTGGIGGNIAITSPGILNFNRSDALTNPITYSSILSGNGMFIKDGASTLIFNNSANTFSGSAVINNGTLTVGADNVVPNATVTVKAGGTFSVLNNATISSLSGAGTTSVASGKALTLNGVSTLSSVISGTGGVTFGSGINVVANQLYTGVTSIPSGVLIIGNTTATATIAGNITTNPSSSIPSSINFQNSGPSTYAGIISGAGSLSLNGAGNLTLSGVNTYTGSTFVNSAALIVGIDNAVPNGFVTVGANGTFSVANNQTISSLSGAGITTVASGKTLTLANGGPLSSVISGAGNVALSGVVTMTSNQAYTGNTILNNTGSPLTLNLGNNTASGMVAGNIVTTGSNTGVQVNRTDAVTYGGVISGNGFLNKNNANTLTLTGQNTYTGSTNVNGGTLVIGATNALPTTTGLGLATGAILDVANDQTITRFISNAFGSTIKIQSGKTLTAALGSSLTTNNGFGTAFYGNITDGTVPGTGGKLVIGADSDGRTIGLFGTNTYTGGTTINPNGKLLLGNNDINGTTGSIVGNVVNNGLLIFNRGSKTTFTGDISGTGSVSQGNSGGSSTGDTFLTGNNTYTGGTTIFSKTLVVGDGATNGSILGNVNLVTNSTVPGNAPALAFYRSDAISFAGVVSGNGKLFKAGAGKLTLTGQSTYVGDTYVGNTTITGGTLAIGIANALPTTTQLSLAASSALDVLNNQTIAGFLTAGDLTSALHLATGTTFTVAMPVANTSTTFAGVVDGAGIFAVSGAGGDVVNLTGTVASTVGTSIGAGATLNIASGGSLASPIALAAGSVLTLSNPGPQTFANVISGPGSLISSTGSSTLTAPNTYAGGTIINGGKIIVSNTSGSATGTGPVVVNTGGILGGSGTISGSLTLNSGSTISPGNSPGLLTVGPTIFAASAGFTFDINNTSGTPGTNWDILNITGPLTITATLTNPFVINLVSLDSANNAGLLAGFNPAQSYSWQFVNTTGLIGFSPGVFQYNASQFQNSLAGGFFNVSQAGNNLFLNFSPAAIPEPSTWALLVTGLGTFGFLALRRRTKRS